MAELEVDIELLWQFEKNLDPRFPERSAIPTRVLGYGEISTVLEIGTGPQRELAYKRLPMFKTEQEAEAYERLYHDYVQVLRDRVGLQVVEGRLVRLVDEASGRVIVYIVQKQLPPRAVGHQAIRHLSPAGVRQLCVAVLQETSKVFAFNQANRGRLEVGFDGQISNWAIQSFDPEAPGVVPQEREMALLYFDTSTPFLRRDGREQLNPELFLRSAPAFLVWILRLLFLEDVMTRYYDQRQVTVDLIANLYKEQRPDLVPELVETVNRFFNQEIARGDMEPLAVDEVRAYYREDAWIWRLYLAFRRIDRALHRLVGREYPYVLPGKIQR